MASPQGLSVFDIQAEACRRLGLKAREATLVRDCVRALTLVPNGHLLITPGRIPAARRLMERGFLVQAEKQPTPFNPTGFGLVVVMKQVHLDKLINDANAAIKAG